MKKVVVFSLLLALIVGCVVPMASGRVNVSFVAVNDTIPLTLSASEQPFYNGGVLYAPYTAFNANGLSFFVTYTKGSQFLTLFNQTKRLVFDVTSDSVTDENGDQQSVDIVSRNGYIFLPASFCSQYFGTTASYLTSQDGYPVLRFTTGSEIYDNALFIQRAENFIAYQIEQIESPAPPTIPSIPTPPTTTTPTAPEVNIPEPEVVPATVHIAIMGIEYLEENLAKLREKRLFATFFLTPEEILTNGDTLRSLHASGHYLGIYATSAQEIADANLAFAAISLPQTLLVTTAYTMDEPTLADYYCVFPQTENPLTPEVAAVQHGSTNYVFLHPLDVTTALDTFQTEEALVYPLRETDFLQN